VFVPPGCHREEAYARHRCETGIRVSFARLFKDAGKRSFAACTHYDGLSFVSRLDRVFATDLAQERSGHVALEP